MAKRYNTVKTMKAVVEEDNTATRRAIDSCGPFLTPEIEAQIDLALGIGTDKLDEDEQRAADEIVLLNEEDTDAILDCLEPTDEDLRAIE
jgi:hypothetical protein